MIEKIKKRKKKKWSQGGKQKERKTSGITQTNEGKISKMDERKRQK